MPMVEEFKRLSKQMDELSRAMIIDPFNDDFFDVFTKKRMELVRAIMNDQPRSIRELSQMVERDVKNVFNDLRLLNESHIIGFQQSGRCKKPVVKSKTIIFRFSRRANND